MRVLRVGSIATVGLAVSAAAAAVAVGQDGRDRAESLKAADRPVQAQERDRAHR